MKRARVLGEGGVLERAQIADPARIEAAFEAGDVDLAVELVEEIGRELYGGRLRISLDDLERWLTRLRARVEDRPWLLFCQSWLWNSQRRLALAAVALTRAERLFAAGPGPERTRGLVLVKLAQGVVAERAANYGAARDAFSAARTLLGATAARDAWIDERSAARWRARDPSGAGAFYLDAIPALRAAGEPLPLARALNNFAHDLLRRGEPGAARRPALESVELKRGLDTDASLANSMNTLGATEHALGMYDVARITLEEARELATRGGHRLIHAYATNNLAEVERDSGDLRLADELYERSLAEKEAMHEEFGQSYGMRSRAVAKRRAGDLEQAAALLERAVRLREPVLDPYEAAQLRVEQGLLAIAGGQTESARAALAETRLVAEEIDAKAVATLARLALASLDDDLGALTAALADAAMHQHLALVRPELAFLRRLHPALRVPGDGIAITMALPARASIFGEFRLELGGRTVDLGSWRSKRAGELVRILVAYRHSSVDRDTLLELLWSDEDAADDKLNAAVNAARRGLEAAGASDLRITRRGDRYRIEHLHWVDADAFIALRESARASIAAGDQRRARRHLRDALGIARGEPYETDRYAEWAAPERTRLTELVQLARESFAALELEDGSPDEAIIVLLDALAREPGRESAHQFLIRAHLARGDRASAMRALVACREALMKELGIAPSPETVALVSA